MTYLIVFLEGIITFISPCLLPMLPVYLGYFAGDSCPRGNRPEESLGRTLRNALGFILGFTLVFVAMGAFAGTLGQLLRSHPTAVNLVTGGLVVLFGLHFLGLLPVNLFAFGRGSRAGSRELGFFSAVVFGVVFSLGWTPCVGAFLGSALMLASQSGSVIQGVVMLLCYSLGLGLPFLLSALLLQRLAGAFLWIKAHYTIINRICGGFLVLVGLAMMTGLLGRLLGLLAS